MLIRYLELIKVKNTITYVRMVKEMDSFLYFAYGSNLLKKRILINNPSAEFVGIGKLDDHQLNFIKYSDNWRGCSATILPIANCYIWGAVWRLHNRDLQALDKQEGVNTNWYFPKIVEVVSPEGIKYECRTYQQSINPEFSDISMLPEDRRPSVTYLECIIKGATECQLPENYIEKLKTIPHNGQEASKEMIEKLNMKTTGS